MDQSRGSLTLLSITLGSVQEAKLEMTFRKVVFSTKKRGCRSILGDSSADMGPKTTRVEEIQTVQSDRSQMWGHNGS